MCSKRVTSDRSRHTPTTSTSTQLPHHSVVCEDLNLSFPTRCGVVDFASMSLRKQSLSETESANAL